MLCSPQSSVVSLKSIGKNVRASPYHSNLLDPSRWSIITMEHRVTFYFERLKRVKLEFHPEFAIMLGKLMNDSKSCTIWFILSEKNSKQELEVAAVHVVAQFTLANKWPPHCLKDSWCCVDFVWGNNSCYEIFCRVHWHLVHFRFHVPQKKKPSEFRSDERGGQTATIANILQNMMF